MALKDEWIDKVNGVDDVNAEDINLIAQAVIAIENKPQNKPAIEIWTFTLEDGSTVKKAVYAENAQKTITMSVPTGSPSADVTCNGQTYYGSTSFNANIGDTITLDIFGYTGITLTVNGVVIRDTSITNDTYTYEHIVTSNTLIEHCISDTDNRAYVTITDE